MATVLITGGTGLVGKALGQALLEKGYRVIILSRQAGKKSSIQNLAYATWDAAKQTIDKEAISQADHIIHLAGAGVADKRWTKKRKQEIIDSRIYSSKLIVDSLQSIPNNVKSVISASAIGWYGADRLIPSPSPLSGEGGNVLKFVESDPADKAFLGDTCKRWEESIAPVIQSGKRLVKLRIGIVLSKNGGALKEFLKPLKFGVAAVLGNGKQIISWIHIDDLVRLFIEGIENEKMNGTYNAVAPHPVSNKELTLALARSRKIFFIPIYVPAFILKLMLGEMSIEILKSATVSADKILNTGFQFEFPFIDDALKNNG
jgi:uncharacterized protein (TIGR01777 family)